MEVVFVRSNKNWSIVHLITTSKPALWVCLFTAYYEMFLKVYNLSKLHKITKLYSIESIFY